VIYIVTEIGKIILRHCTTVIAPYFSQYFSASVIVCNKGYINYVTNLNSDMFMQQWSFDK